MKPNARLLAAAKAGDLNAVRAALLAGASPDAQHDYVEYWDRESMSGQESVLQLAARAGHVEIVAELLSLGADPNARDTLRGSSPLLAAVARGELRVVSILMAAGAVVEADPERPERDALAIAIEAGHREVAAALVRAGAQATPRALELACHRGDPGLAELCLRSGADVADPQALVAAARTGDVATLRWLLDQSANQSAYLGAAGGEALCEAANAGRHEAVRFLLARGVSTAFQNSYGWPPLHFAAYQSDAALCEILLHAGADPRAVDHAGRTAADWASEAGRVENVATIERARAAS